MLKMLVRIRILSMWNYLVQGGSTKKKQARKGRSALLLAVLFCMPIVPLLSGIFSTVRERDRAKLFLIRPVFNIIALYISTAMLVGQSYNPFLYFRF